MAVPLKPVHAMLGKLIKDLRSVNKAELVAKTTNAPKKGAAKTPDEWIFLLEVAQREIEEWCPTPGGDSPFFIDVTPQS